MTANIHEPTHARSIAQTRAVGKDTRQRPYAGRWIKPLDIGETPDATDPDYTPTLQNDFVQTNAPFTKWAFRMAYSGDLQFQGVLNVSDATNGTVAITLPGYNADEPYFAPPHDQGYTTKVTVDGTTVLNAVATVDASTGDVVVSWLNPGVGIHEIKVFEDTVDVVVGDDAFIWEVPEDLDAAEIIRVAGFISTAGGGSTQVALRLGAAGAGGSDILANKITIDSGEYNSKDAGTQPSLSGTTIVAWGQHLHIDVDAAGGGAKGLGIHVIYSTEGIGSIGLTGVRGPPGGVTQFQGQWQTGTTYNAGDIVTNNNVTYVVTADHTSDATTEPGVGANWEDFLAPLFEFVMTAATHLIIASTYPLISGIKGAIMLPWAGTITSATLLADTAGDIEVDIWNTNYGGYPPSSANSITGATPLTLTGAIKTQDTALTGWTTAVSEDDVLVFNVNDDAVNITRLTVALKIEKAA